MKEKVTDTIVEMHELEKQIAELRVSQCACIKDRSNESQLRFQELTQMIWLRLEQLQSLALKSFGRRN